MGPLFGEFIAREPRSRYFSRLWNEVTDDSAEQMAMRRNLRLAGVQDKDAVDITQVDAIDDSRRLRVTFRRKKRRAR
jgi:hypothetical protein